MDRRDLRSRINQALYPVLIRYALLDTLAVSAQGFRRGANRVRKQMWWVISAFFPLPKADAVL